MSTKLTTKEENALLRLYPQRISMATYSFANDDAFTLAVLARSIAEDRKPVPTLLTAKKEACVYRHGEWRYGGDVLITAFAAQFMTRLWNAENPEHRIEEVTEDE